MMADVKLPSLGLDPGERLQFLDPINDLDRARLADHSVSRDRKRKSRPTPLTISPP
jgi:hypothetical protein